jgi:Ca2+-binding RTX toxin-like protein
LHSYHLPRDGAVLVAPVRADVRYSVVTTLGTTTVADTNTADGDAGTATLRNVETLRFSDQDVTIIQAVTIPVTLTSSADVYITPTSDNYLINASGGNDSVTGGAGNDTITGGTGNDTISSGGGDDRILFATGKNGFDAIDGGTGLNDRISATAAGVTIGLESLIGIEAIDAGGFADVKTAGSTAASSLDFSAVSLNGITQIDAGSGNDTVLGSTADDVIIGGKGNDTLRGNGGNDLFKVGASTGTDIYDGGLGADRIEAWASNVTMTVTGTNIAGVETISSAGFAGFKLVGTRAANTLGFSGVALSGIALISGGSGNDAITGSAVADFIEGGAGRDTSTGGAGADTFVFNSASHSKGSSNIDRITDFLQGQDRIDLSTIDANTQLVGNDAFSFIGNVAGQLRFDTTSIAGVTRMLADIDGNSATDMEIHLTGTYALQASDFLL